MRSAAVKGFGVALGAIDAGAGAGIVAAANEARSTSRDVAVSLLEQPKVNETAHRKRATQIDPGLLL
jgi:hypothetical protein